MKISIMPESILWQPAVKKRFLPHFHSIMTDMNGNISLSMTTWSLFFFYKNLDRLSVLNWRKLWTALNVESSGFDQLNPRVIKPLSNRFIINTRLTMSRKRLRVANRFRTAFFFLDIASNQISIHFHSIAASRVLSIWLSSASLLD